MFGFVGHPRRPRHRARQQPRPPTSSAPAPIWADVPSATVALSTASANSAYAVLARQLWPGRPTGRSTLSLLLFALIGAEPIDPDAVGDCSPAASLLGGALRRWCARTAWRDGARREPSRPLRPGRRSTGSMRGKWRSDRGCGSGATATKAGHAEKLRRPAVADIQGQERRRLMARCRGRSAQVAPAAPARRVRYARRPDCRTVRACAGCRWRLIRATRVPRRGLRRCRGC